MDGLTPPSNYLKKKETRKFFWLDGVMILVKFVLVFERFFLLFLFFLFFKSIIIVNKLLLKYLKGFY